MPGVCATRTWQKTALQREKPPLLPPVSHSHSNWQYSNAQSTFPNNSQLPYSSYCHPLSAHHAPAAETLGWTNLTADTAHWSIHLFPCMQARQLQHERNTQSVRKKSIRWWTGRSSPNWYSINVFHINKFDDRKIIRELRQYKEKPERLSRLWWLRLLRIWSNLQTSQWTSNTKPT